MEQAERAKSFNDNHLLQKFLLFRVAFLNSLGLQLLHESVACKRLACCGGFQIQTINYMLPLKLATSELVVRSALLR